MLRKLVRSAIQTVPFFFCNFLTTGASVPTGSLHRRWSKQKKHAVVGQRPTTATTNKNGNYRIYQ